MSDGGDGGVSGDTTSHSTDAGSWAADSHTSHATHNDAPSEINALLASAHGDPTHSNNNDVHKALSSAFGDPGIAIAIGNLDQLSGSFDIARRDVTAADGVTAETALMQLRDDGVDDVTKVIAFVAILQMLFDRSAAHASDYTDRLLKNINVPQDSAVRLKIVKLNLEAAEKIAPTHLKGAADFAERAVMQLPDGDERMQTLQTLWGYVDRFIAEQKDPEKPDLTHKLGNIKRLLNTLPHRSPVYIAAAGKLWSEVDKLSQNHVGLATSLIMNGIGLNNLDICGQLEPALDRLMGYVDIIAKDKPELAPALALHTVYYLRNGSEPERLRTALDRMWGYVDETAKTDPRKARRFVKDNILQDNMPLAIRNEGKVKSNAYYKLIPSTFSVVRSAVSSRTASLRSALVNFASRLG